MIYNKNQNLISIAASTYALELDEKKISVILAGEEVACLRPASAVNTYADGEVAEDDLCECLTLTEEKAKDSVTFTWTGKSSLWEKKEYVLIAREDHFEYFIRVTGKGAVETVNYFSGAITKAGAGSAYEFDTGYTPIPTVKGDRQCEFSAQNSFDEFSYLTVPPMFCYIFDIVGMNSKLAMGLVADRGEHNFTKFAYTTKWNGEWDCRFWLWTDQSGHTKVDGEWKTPSVIVYGTEGRYDALRYYSEYYFTTGRADRKDPMEQKPRFWYGPIACGWIEQAAYGIKEHIPRSGTDMAYQPLYDHFNEELARRGLKPQLMIIDDKWQTQYGTAEVNLEKWPDLRGWIDENREKNNRYTMLWYMLWNSEGLPEEMTMYNEANDNRVADPSNPAYREYLKKQIHYLLSSDEGCCNAYGFKLDYAFTQPLGHKSESYSGKYGVELFLDYISLIHESVKAAKPEAIVNASPCHPLFAKYVDQARLHDYFPALRRCYEEFEFRKEIYSIALPGVLIDTDGAAFRTHRDTMRFMKLAPKIGIPDLYCITETPVLSLTDEEWDTVANVWAAYEAEIDSRF